VYIPRQTDASQLVELEGTEAALAAAKAEIESILRVQVIHSFILDPLDSLPSPLPHEPLTHQH
jgi:hypothetical protein